MCAASDLSIGGFLIGHNPMVSSINSDILQVLPVRPGNTRSSKALGWTNDPTDDFWHHQFDAICEDQD